MLRGLAEFERGKNERSDFYILTKYGKRTLDFKFRTSKILIIL